MSQAESLTPLELRVPLMVLRVIGYRAGGSTTDGAMVGPDRLDGLRPKASSWFLLDVQLPCGALTTVTIDSETFEQHVRGVVDGAFRPTEGLEDPETAAAGHAEEEE